MTLKELEPIDLNSADLETLCLLPGIGPTLAERIIAARPYETVQDLTRVQGIGPAVLERWVSHLTVWPAAVEPPVSEPDTGTGEGRPAEVAYVEVKVGDVEPFADAEPDQVEAEPARPVDEDEPPARPEATARATSKRQRPAATHSYVGWMVAVSGLVLLALSLLLNLGILAALNGNRLQFASPDQISALTLRIEGLETRVDGFGQDVEGLRTRLSNLEAMGERMSAVELAAETLRTDVDAIATDTSDLSTRVDAIEGDLVTASEQLSDLETKVETLQAQGGRFQTFLEGLQALMDSLFRTEGGQ
ncbi:MAG: helix-hairpin-helix domain-containing protein [Anaerolineae bacterium]|nr:helix-hairpin-helix domain-containing protein [Anaerolineae bacterium]